MNIKKIKSKHLIITLILALDLAYISKMYVIYTFVLPLYLWLIFLNYDRLITINSILIDYILYFFVMPSIFEDMTKKYFINEINGRIIVFIVTIMIAYSYLYLKRKVLSLEWKNLIKKN